MICYHCHTDNPRSLTDCGTCGAKLNAIRHSCSFVNITTDMYCGGCGQSLLKTTAILRRRQADDFFDSASRFSEQEMLFLLEAYQQRSKIKGKAATINQTDVDKLFL